MQGIIQRDLSDTIKMRLQNNPAVAILGPRQCGQAGAVKKAYAANLN